MADTCLDRLVTEHHGRGAQNPLDEVNHWHRYVAITELGLDTSKEFVQCLLSQCRRVVFVADSVYGQVVIEMFGTVDGDLFTVVISIEILDQSAHSIRIVFLPQVKYVMLCFLSQSQQRPKWFQLSNHCTYQEVTKKCLPEPDGASICQNRLVAVQTIFSELYNDIRESWIVVEFLLSLRC